MWSTDWWVGRAGTLQKLDAKLQGLLQASRAKRAEEAEKQAAADAAAAAIAKARDEAAPLDAVPATAAGTSGATQVQLGLGLKSQPAEQQPLEQDTEVYARSAAGGLAAAAVFVESDPASVVDAVKADAFFDSGYDTVLLAMIAHVVEVEGPVLDTVLARRIARAHGWQRTGRGFRSGLRGWRGRRTERPTRTLGRSTGRQHVVRNYRWCFATRQTRRPDQWMRSACLSLWTWRGRSLRVALELKTRLL